MNPFIWNSKSFKITYDDIARRHEGHLKGNGNARYSDWEDGFQVSISVITH